MSFGPGFWITGWASCDGLSIKRPPHLCAGGGAAAAATGGAPPAAAGAAGGTHGPAAAAGSTGSGAAGAGTAESGAAAAGSAGSDPAGAGSVTAHAAMSGGTAAVTAPAILVPRPPAGSMVRGDQSRRLVCWLLLQQPLRPAGTGLDSEACYLSSPTRAAAPAPPLPQTAMEAPSRAGGASTRTCQPGWWCSPRRGWATTPTPCSVGAAGGRWSGRRWPKNMRGWRHRTQLLPGWLAEPAALGLPLGKLSLQPGSMTTWRAGQAATVASTTRRRRAPRCASRCAGLWLAALQEPSC